MAGESGELIAYESEADGWYEIGEIVQVDYSGGRRHITRTSRGNYRVHDCEVDSMKATPRRLKVTLHKIR